MHIEQNKHSQSEPILPSEWSLSKCTQCLESHLNLDGAALNFIGMTKEGIYTAYYLHISFLLKGLCICWSLYLDVTCF